MYRGDASWIALWCFIMMLLSLGIAYEESRAHETSVLQIQQCSARLREARAATQAVADDLDACIDSNLVNQ
jgi:hypothetical protein